MNTYNNESIGKIVIIRNLIFHDSKTGKKELDHAWKLGRPCIIIYSDNEYDYLLPIKSSIEHTRYRHHYFLLNEDKFLHKNIRRIDNYNIKEKRKRKTEGAINLKRIYKIPISWHDETGKISFSAYKELITKLKEYHQKEDLNTILENAQIVRGR